MLTHSCINSRIDSRIDSCIDYPSILLDCEEVPDKPYIISPLGESSPAGFLTIMEDTPGVIGKATVLIVLFLLINENSNITKVLIVVIG